MFGRRLHVKQFPVDHAIRMPAHQHRRRVTKWLVVEVSAIAERAVQAIQDTARTEKIGDGKIFVLPVEQAIRIRTGEQGPDAV